ncbi:ABC transporter permease [Niabella aurantiaca]|uniref:ABC transporter permease n=1 Tax=Niabella aurantiaca TaxID=379900 RepID=UPI0003668C59|nr:ABC transporter permease [Niabella aurantiaca]
MIKNYFKTAWRSLWKSKGFSLLNILGLAIGLASCLLLLLYANYHLGWDKRFKDLENIYVIESNQFADNDVFTYQVSPGPMAKAIQDQVPGVVRAVRVADYFAGGITRYKDRIFRTSGLNADSAFFRLFSYAFLRGNARTALANPNNIVITEEFSKKLFGDEDPVGKTVMRNDTVPLVVSAVVATPRPNETFQFDYILPWRVLENENPWAKDAGWGSNFTDTYVQLRSENDFLPADAVIRKMVMANQNNYKAEAFLYPLARNHLYRDFKNGKATGSGQISQIRLFIYLSIAILLIACINFMNLSTARSQKRAREVGILKTIGSDRRSLVFRFLGESLLITVLGLLVSLLILTVALPSFNRLLQIDLKLPFSDWEFWAGIVLMTLLTSLIAGSYPAFYLSSFKPVKVLKGFITNGKSVVPVRKISVVLQFSTAMFLMVATFSIYKQVEYIRNRPIGYNKENLVEIKMEGVLGAKKDVLINDLLRDNVITAATGTSISITQGGNNGWGFSWPGKLPGERVLIDFLGVGFGFTKTFGTVFITGRDFSPDHPADTAGKNVLISETAMKVMKLRSPIGTQIKEEDGTQYTIVGVFKDITKGSPYYKLNPMIVFYQNRPGFVAMRLNPEKNITASVEAINRELKKRNPAFPPGLEFVEENFAKKYQNEQILGIVTNVFGGIAIFLSCLGLLGLSAFAAEQRTKEIGVRKVLGADVLGLTALLTKEFLKLVMVSFIIAVPVSWWCMQRWLDKYDHHTNLSAGIYLLAGITVLLIALLTVSTQGLKAAVANPVKALRSE